jgi:uncharacterized protein YkwD
MRGKFICALTALLATTALAASAAPAGAVTCKGADLDPTVASLPDVRGATRCLINNERSHRGLKRLRSNPALNDAATSYAKLMVAKEFFDHVTPTGVDLLDRILNTDYLNKGQSYSIGENLAWGTGSYATPRSIVRQWMHSPGHRRNILDKHFRDLGLGIVRGVPDPSAGSGATYVNEFGARG